MNSVGDLRICTAERRGGQSFERNNCKETVLTVVFDARVLIFFALRFDQSRVQNYAGHGLTLVNL